MKDVTRAYMKTAHAKRNKCEEPFRMLWQLYTRLLRLSSFCSLSVLDDINVGSVSQCKSPLACPCSLARNSYFEKNILCVIWLVNPAHSFIVWKNVWNPNISSCLLLYKKNGMNTWSGQILFFLLRSLILFLVLALRTSHNFTSAQPSQLDSYDFYCALLSQLSCAVAHSH